MKSTHYSLQIEDAVWLAERKFLRQLIELLVDKRVKRGVDSMIYAFYNSKEQAPQKRALGWLRSDQAYMGDRAIRLFIDIFGQRALFQKELSIHDIRRFCELYEVKYPRDDILPNRLYYLIQDVRGENIFFHEKCSQCGHPFVTHRDDAHLKVCNICRQLEC